MPHVPSLSNLGAQLEERFVATIQTPQDFDRIRLLSEENGPDWIHPYSKDGVDMWYKETPDSNVYLVRGEAYLRGVSCQAVEECLYNMDVRIQWDIYLQKAQSVERLDANRDVAYYLFKTPLSSLIYDRDFLQARHLKRNFPSEGCVTILYKSIDHPAKPPYKQYVRANTIISGQILTPVAEGVRVTLFGQNDLRGLIPKAAINLLAFQAPLKFFGRLHEASQLLTNNPDHFSQHQAKEMQLRAQKTTLLQSTFPEWVQSDPPPPILGFYECTVSMSKVQGTLFITPPALYFAPHLETYYKFTLESVRVAKLQKKNPWMITSFIGASKPQLELTIDQLSATVVLDFGDQKLRDEACDSLQTVSAEVRSQANLPLDPESPYAALYSY
jgi:hypothetical protein